MFDWAKHLAEQQAQALLRHALNGFGAGLVAKGLMTNDQATAITGGIMALVAVLWSLWQKNRATAALQGAVAAGAAQPVIVTTSPADPTPAVATEADAPADLRGLY